MARNKVFDNVKLFTIFLVVFGHLIEPIINQSNVIKVIYMSIYSFHMPIFIILAGMLTKLDTSEERTRKNIIALIVPFIVFTVLYELFELIVDREISTYTLNLQPYWILWFLFSMFIWKMFLPVIMEFRYPLLLSIIISLTVGYIDDVGYFLGVSRTLYFFPFFIFGFKLGSSGLTNKYLIKIPKIVYLAVIILNVAFFWEVKDFPHQWLYGSYSYERSGNTQIYAFVIRTFLYLVSFTTSIAVIMLIPKNTSKLSNFGQNSLFVYVWHGFFIKIAMHFDLIKTYGHNSPLLTLSALFFIAIILTIFLAIDFISQQTRLILLQPLQKFLLDKG